MALYPEVLKKAQEEIDAVVGNQRLPQLLDRVNLPYIDAVVREVLRWNVVGPTGNLILDDSSIRSVIKLIYLQLFPIYLPRMIFMPGILYPRGRLLFLTFSGCT
jgi:hypothetical protein